MDDRLPSSASLALLTDLERTSRTPRLAGSTRTTRSRPFSRPPQRRLLTPVQEGWSDQSNAETSEPCGERLDDNDPENRAYAPRTPSELIGESLHVLIHKSRNILQRGQSSLELLRFELGPASRSREVDDLLSRLNAAHDDWISLIDQLRDFLEPIEARPISCRPVALFLATWEDLFHGHADRIHVTPREAASWSCWADPELLEQCFTQILINAAEAVDDLPCVDLEVYGADDNGNETSGPNMSWIELTIRDHGPGPTADLDLQIADPSRLCEPFVTTKRSRLGVGLTIARRVLESFGGSLTIRYASHAESADSNSHASPDSRFPTDRSGLELTLRLPRSPR